MNMFSRFWFSGTKNIEVDLKYNISLNILPPTLYIWNKLVFSFLFDVF